MYFPRTMLIFKLTANQKKMKTNDYKPNPCWGAGSNETCFTDNHVISL